MSDRRITKGTRALQAVIKERGQQASLAAELGVEPPTFSRWLSGERQPSTTYRAMLEERLGIDWRLWDEEVDESPESGRSTPAEPDEPPASVRTSAWPDPEGETC